MFHCFNPAALLRSLLYTSPSLMHAGYNCMSAPRTGNELNRVHVDTTAVDLHQLKVDIDWWLMSTRLWCEHCLKRNTLSFRYRLVRRESRCALVSAESRSISPSIDTTPRLGGMDMQECYIPLTMNFAVILVAYAWCLLLMRFIKQPFLIINEGYRLQTLQKQSFRWQFCAQRCRIGSVCVIFALVLISNMQWA